MKIGIYSGSFDPIHIGHAMIANYLSQYCGLDEVWLMPSPLNPLKLDALPAEVDHRMNMARIVAGKCCDVKVSDYELSLPSPSYTYRTLCSLKRDWPEHDFTLVIGSDNWCEFHRWKNPDKIIREFSILIYPRPGYEIEEKLPDRVSIVREAPQALISSTFIRDGIRSGKNMNFFLDPQVADYIIKHKLYE